MRSEMGAASKIVSPRLVLVLLLLVALLCVEPLVAGAQIQVPLEVVGIALLAAVAIVSVLLNAHAVDTARSELAAQHRLFEGLFTASCVGLAITDDHGCWVKVNPALCRMLGYEPQDLEGRPFSDVTHPDDLDSSRSAFVALLGGATGGLELEKRYITARGEVVHVALTASSFTEGPSGRHYHVVQIRDVSSRREAEEALQNERELLASFLRATSYHVCFKDGAGRYIRVSDSHVRSLGFETQSQAIGKTDFDVFPPDIAESAASEEREVIDSGQSIIDSERLVRFPDGRQVWMLTSKLPLEDAGSRVVGTVTVSHDITIRRRAVQALQASEDRWRALLAEVDEIVVLVDRDGTMRYVSPSVGRLFGVEPHNLIGQRLLSFTHVDDRTELAAALKEVRAGAPVSLSRRVRNRAGEWRSLESRVVCLEHVEAGAVLVISRDMTDRLALERERERLALDRQVSQRLEAVGQLSAGIAHEINTPLQFVGDSVTFLRDAVDDLLELTARYREGLFVDAAIPLEERRQAMRRAEQDVNVEYLTDRIPAAFERTVEGIERVRTIVQAMKRFSHASSTEVEEADLNDAIETTLEVCRNEYKYVADVVLDLAELPPVTCNVGEINQVLLNLIVNAAQALQETVAETDERGTIEVSSRAEAGAVTVSIADNGPGIPAEIQHRIYEPFFTTKEVGKGTGQGLALVRATVERHDGSLECISTPGSGTTFTIRLPVEPPGCRSTRNP